MTNLHISDVCLEEHRVEVYGPFSTENEIQTKLAELLQAKPGRSFDGGEREQVLNAFFNGEGELEVDGWRFDFGPDSVGCYYEDALLSFIQWGRMST